MPVLCLLAVCVFVRLYALTRQSVSYDEGFSLTFSSGNHLGEVVKNLEGSDSSERFQPLYFATLFGWRQAFGSSETSLRLCSVLGGVLASAMIWLAARRAFGPVHALWTLALVSVSAYGVMYAQEIRPYSWLIFLSMLVVWQYLQTFHGCDAAVGRVDRDNSLFGRDLLKFYSVAVLASIGSVFVIIFMCAIGLVDRVYSRSWNVWLTRWLIVGACCLPAAAFYGRQFVAQRGTNTISQLRNPLAVNLAFSYYGLVAGTTFGPPIELLHGEDRAAIVWPYWPRFVLLGAALLTIASLAALFVRRGWSASNDDELGRHQGELALMLLAVVAVYSLLIIAFLVISKLNLQPRHMFALFGPGMMFLPIPILSRAKLTSNLAKSALVALILLNGLSLYNYFFQAAHWRDGYRDAALSIKASRQAGEPVVVVWGNQDVLKYYGITDSILALDVSPAALSPTVEKLTASAPNVIVFANREFYWGDRNITVPVAVKSDYEVAGVERFPYINLYHLKRRS